MLNTRPLHNKDYYRQLPTINGYKWGGYLCDEGLHFFVSGNYRDGFKECRVLESEIHDKSHLYMMKRGFTR